MWRGVVAPRAGQATALHVIDPGVHRVLSAQEGHPGRGAGRRRRVGLSEAASLAGQPIELRGLIDRLTVDPVAGNILPAEVIDHDMDDVGSRGGMECRSKHQRQENSHRAAAALLFCLHGVRRGLGEDTLAGSKEGLINGGARPSLTLAGASGGLVRRGPAPAACRPAAQADRVWEALPVRATRAESGSR